MVIVFDCDGVLVDSEIIANRVLAALLSRHGYPITAMESVKKFAGGSIPGVIQQVIDEGYDLPDDFEEQLRERDAKAFEAELKPVAGIQATLEQLIEIPKCVASSGPPSKIQNNLKLTGLIKYLDPHLYSGRSVPNPKPAPDLFYHVANRMGVDPSICTVIEDSPVGVLGAKRAGMRAFGFIGASHRTKDDIDSLKAAGADLVFEDMTELPRLLRQPM